MDNLKGVLYISLSATCFGIMPILAKLSYSGGSNTYTVLFLRFGIASVILLWYLLHNDISIKLGLKQAMLLVFLGVAGYGATEIAIFSSYKYISVGLASNILYSYPAIVTLLSLFVYKERLYFSKVISLVFSLIGIYILVGFKNTSFNVAGALLAFSAAIFYSIYVLIISSEELKKINNYVITFYVSLSASVSMLILGISTNTLKFNFSFYSLVCIILLAVISTVIALMAFLEGVKIIGPSKASILSTLEPIVSLLLGWIILKEKILLQVIIGSSLVITSVIILATDTTSKKEKLVKCNCNKITLQNKENHIKLN